MNILFFTNIPSPYRVDFFNELGKSCDLTVCFERRAATDRNPNWVGAHAQNYQEVYLDLKAHGADDGKGNGMIKYIKANPTDLVIFSGYSSPATVLAILYCRLHRVRYFIEYDGGFNKKDPPHKRFLKSLLIRGAAGHFITCEEMRQYLLGFRVSAEKLHFYPFSSLKKEDILPSVPTDDEKKQLKQTLGIVEEKAILAVGQFIPRKGFDILLEAAAGVDKNAGLYIVGGEPTEEYLAMTERLSLTQVHFVGFKSKNELAEYYKAVDLFVMPTREDIWGLVVNEAMAKGLPVVSTDRCIAALEIIRKDENGYVVPVEDAKALANAMNAVIREKEKQTAMSRCSLQSIADYTIENMARAHVEILLRQ